MLVFPVIMCEGEKEVCVCVYERKNNLSVHSTKRGKSQPTMITDTGKLSKQNKKKNNKKTSNLIKTWFGSVEKILITVTSLNCVPHALITRQHSDEYINC